MSNRPWLNSRLFLPILGVLLMVIALACGNSATSTSAPAGAAVATAVPVAATTAAAATAAPSGHLNIAFKEMGPYLGHPCFTANPTVGHATLAAYEGLVTADVTGKHGGRLAESWSLAPDNVTWTFNLAKGVPFHGGAGMMTAEDVIWSIQQLGCEGSLAGLEIDIRRNFMNPDGGMTALDDHTIEVDTGSPQWDVLIWLTNPGSTGAWIVSKSQTEELVESIGLESANRRLAGTGPWELVDEQTGEFWKFKAVADHWRKTPFFAEMTFHEIPEESTRVANFQTGRIDTYGALPDSLPALARVEGTKFMVQERTSQTHLGLYGSWYIGVGTPDQRPGYEPDKLPWVSANPDTSSPEWERARKVREAMAISIDRDLIIEQLLGGEGGHLTMWGYMGSEDRELPHWKWEYDVERAKQLLKDAGYEDGFELTLNPAIRGAPAEQEACEAVGDMWADIGITAHFGTLPYATIRAEWVERTWQGISCHATPPFPEPLAVWGFSYNPEFGWNSGLEHDFLQPKVDEATGISDVEERWKVETELGSWLWDNVLDIGLYTQNTVYPLGPEVDSWADKLGRGDARVISNMEWAPLRK